MGPVVTPVVHNIYIDIKFAIEFCSSSIKANKESGTNVRVQDRANTDGTVGNQRSVTTSGVREWFLLQ